MSPKASLVLPSESFDAPEARAVEPFSSPGLAGSAGSPLMPVFRAWVPSASRELPSVILAVALSRPGCSGSPGTPSMPTRILGGALGEQRGAHDHTPGCWGRGCSACPPGWRTGCELARAGVELAGAGVELGGPGLELGSPGIEPLGAGKDLWRSCP